MIQFMEQPHFNRGRKRPDLAEWNRKNKTITTPVLERLAAKSVTVGDCLIWTGAKIKGYGSIQIEGRTKLVHREAWIARHGPLPRKTPLVLHHCDNPLCWADAHLYAGTYADNMRDRTARGRNPQTAKTSCPRGHPYDAENTYVSKNGSRRCRACRRVTS